MKVKTKAQFVDPKQGSGKARERRANFVDDSKRQNQFGSVTIALGLFGGLLFAESTY